MQFQTKVSIEPADFDIHHRNRIFAIGSCFVEEIGDKLVDLKYNILINPFGNLYNVVAIENALLRIYSRQYYTEEEIFEYEGVYHSWDHHSKYSWVNPQEMLDRINRKIDEANDFLRETDRVMITLGTSYYYVLKDLEVPVANCHKVPQSNFEKRLLSVDETAESLKNIEMMIRDISNKTPKLILTLSPVKHLKDGLVNNSRSKAIALEGIYQFLNKNTEKYYFPSYEIVQDELRDYRFYNEAMTHPNDLAIHYIWERFSDTFFNEETHQLNAQIEKIQKQKNHRPRFEESASHLKNQRELEQKIADLQSKYPFIKL